MAEMIEMEQVCSRREQSGLEQADTEARHPHGPVKSRQPSQHQAARKIEPSLQHMLQHLTEPLRISKLSALSGVSTSYFFSLFKCATGRAPIDFFIRLRIQRACELLRDRKLSIKEVATALGYDDPFYFSRLFKSVIGVAPRGYRARLLNAPAPEPLSGTEALLYSSPRPAAALSEFVSHGMSHDPVNQQNRRSIRTFASGC
jgi:AraC-like DNA-binding protein